MTASGPPDGVPDGRDAGRDLRGLRRRRSLAGFAFDGVLAGSVGAAIIVTSPPGADRPLAQVLALGAAAALLVRRVWPWTVLAVVTGVAAVCMRLGDASPVVVAAPSLAMYAAAQRNPWRRTMAAGGLALVVVASAYLLAAGHGRKPELLAVVSVAGVALLLPAATAAAVRVRRESMARAAAEEIRRRVEEERLQIAREVHDALGHALAVISLRAAVALHVGDRQPAQLKESLETVNQVSGAALAELDLTLGVFREADDAAADRPGLGFERLDALVALVRRVGLEVDLMVTGNGDGVPVETERAAYRIIQESLTNVLHHAGPVRATVEIGYEPEVLMVRVANGVAGGDGRTSTAAPGSGSGGNGLRGMRDRVAVLGGTLEAGPLPDGGFLVMARLPC
jgi:signal transduction histidine kinase